MAGEVWEAYAIVARSAVVVGRQLGVRIRSHRPLEETEARPDQTSCMGRRNADTLGANWRCP